MNSFIREIKEHSVESLFMLWLVVVIVQYISSYYYPISFGLNLDAVYVIMLLAVICTIALRFVKKLQK